MTKHFTSAKKLRLCIYGLFAIFYFWLAAQVPYTHDDWDWGLDVGLHQFLHAAINSRYVGNFMVVIMTRSEILKTLIIGGSCFLIPYLLSRIAADFTVNKTESTEAAYYLIANLLLLAMDRGVWRQTYGWVAGFANYAVSALFMMPWIRELLNTVHPLAQKEEKSLIHFLFLFVLSVASQLFIENLALYHLLLAITLCVIQYHRNRRIPLGNWILLSGAALGMVIMFSSSLYGTLLSTGVALNEARSIPLLTDIGLSSAIYQMCLTLLHLSIGMYAQNQFLTLFILAVISILMYCRCQKGLTRSVLLTVNLILSALVVIGFVYDQSTEDHQTIMYVLDSAVSILYFAAVCIESWLLFRSSKRMLWKLAALWLSVPVVIAPLAITNHTGPRLYFTSNIFVILFGLFLLMEIWKGETPVRRKVILCSTAALCSAFLILHGYAYAQIGACSRSRDAIIEENKTNHGTTITLPAYPFSDYLHFPNPAEDIRVDFFKDFYGIPEDVTVIFE